VAPLSDRDAVITCNNFESPPASRFRMVIGVMREDGTRYFHLKQSSLTAGGTPLDLLLS